MQIKRLELANFRGIKQIDLEFQPGINVIAGKNGVGKSGILRSIVVLLAQISQELGVNRDPQDFDVEDIRNGAKFLQADIICESEGVEFRASLGKSREQVNMHRDDEVEKYSSDSPSGKQVTIEDKSQFSILPNDQFSEWNSFKKSVKSKPLLMVYYGTSRAYFRKLGPSKGSAKSKAHSGALNAEFIDLKEFSAWFNLVEKVPLFFPNSEKFVAQFQSAISHFLPGFSDLRSGTGSA